MLLLISQGFYMFVRAIQLLLEKISGVIMVGLAGEVLTCCYTLSMLSSACFISLLEYVLRQGATNSHLVGQACCVDVLHANCRAFGQRQDGFQC